MKRFKELREKLIIESEFDPYGLYNRSVHTHHGVHRLVTDESLAKINAFIENFLSGNTLTPKIRLEQLRVRLNHIGLDFDLKNASMVDEGTTTIPVTHYGRVFGYRMDQMGNATGEIGDYDYAEERLGRSLTLTVRKTGEGLSDLEGKINFDGEDAELGEDALELRLHIDNDEELFETKIQPALENAEDEDQALRGLIYAVKSAVNNYEMDISEDDIHAVAESILMDSIVIEEEDDDDDLEQVDELKKSTLVSYKEKAKQDQKDIARLNQSTRGPLVGKDRRDFRNRSKGIDGATKRLVARQYEDVEQVEIDELKMPKNPENPKIKDAMRRGAERAAKKSGEEHGKSMMTLQKGDLKGSEKHMEKGVRHMERSLKRG